jgi:hypothetical protein
MLSKPSDITSEITLLSKHYIFEQYAQNLRDINNGECYSFASDLIDRLEDKFGKESLEAYEVEYREYSDFYGGVDSDNPDFDNDILHIEGLISFDSPLPCDLTIEEANNGISMGGGGHGFISAKFAKKTLYFDSLNPEGVATIFDLLLTQFYIHAYNKRPVEAEKINSKMLSIALI